jgi:hypothetical protein
MHVFTGGSMVLVAFCIWLFFWTQMQHVTYIPKVQWFSSRDDLPPRGLLGNVWRHCWLSHLMEKEVVLCYWVEAKGAPKYPAAHRTALPTKNHPQMSIACRLRSSAIVQWWERARKQLDLLEVLRAMCVFSQASPVLLLGSRGAPGLL